MSQTAWSPGPILALDTATAVAMVALGDADGALLAETSWTAGNRHGEELLVRIERMLAEAGTGLPELGAIVVGTGPGAFTGLRVGLATAKGLAHGLGIPVVGVGTGVALLAALAGDGSTQPGPLALLLPAGPSGRIVVDPQGRASLVAGTDGADDSETGLDPGWTAVAVDLAGRAPEDALARGVLARESFARSLLALGAESLRAGRPADLASLVPEYVSLPRGVRAETGEVAWSRDPR
jgi:tRNA threonylcarbamoyl adenosine modification protein YeaZ